MYVRPPSNKGGMSIPENYSGNAFSHTTQYSDMPPPARASQPKQDYRYSDIPQKEIIDTRAEIKESKMELDELENDRNERVKAPQGSLFSSLLPKTNLASHFPFGHGIGSEELLILAVMLLVFLSGNETGEPDGEFLLLLSLLLFAG